MLVEDDTVLGSHTVNINIPYLMCRIKSIIADMFTRGSPFRLQLSDDVCAHNN